MIFIGAYILFLLILLIIRVASFEDESIKSSYYYVLVHNLDENHLELQRLNKLQETLNNYQRVGVTFTLLLPETRIPLQYEDGDTYYKVEKVSDDEQIINLTYELGIGNHPTVNYRVKDGSIEPLFTFGVSNYFLALIPALLVVVVLDLIRYGIKAFMWLKRKT